MNLTTIVKVRDVDWKALKKWYEKDHYNVFYRKQGGLRVILRGRDESFSFPGLSRRFSFPISPGWQEMHFIPRGDNEVLLHVSFNFWATILSIIFSSFGFMLFLVIAITLIELHIESADLDIFFNRLLPAAMGVFCLALLVCYFPKCCTSYFFIFRKNAVKQLKKTGQAL